MRGTINIVIESLKTQFLDYIVVAPLKPPCIFHFIIEPLVTISMLYMHSVGTLKATINLYSDGIL
jgi:hypothetical protein